MPDGIKHNSPLTRAAADLQTKARLPGVTAEPVAPNAPDVGLSAAFRHALGGAPDRPHLPDVSLKTGQAIAKEARSSKPASQRQPASHKAHIGPRSGHK